jgi:hypothetical protein
MDSFVDFKADIRKAKSALKGDLNYSKSKVSQSTRLQTVDAFWLEFGVIVDCLKYVLTEAGRE